MAGASYFYLCEVDGEKVFSSEKLYLFENWINDAGVQERYGWDKMKFYRLPNLGKPVEFKPRRK